MPARQRAAAYQHRAGGEVMKLTNATRSQNAGSLVAALDIGTSKTCCLIATAVTSHERGAQGKLAQANIVALGLGHQNHKVCRLER